MSRPVAALPDLPARLRALADRAEADALDPAQLVGELEALKFQVWTNATNHAPPCPPAGSSRGLKVKTVAERTGMSRDWLYRQVRRGGLPFARRIGRRIVCDEAELTRWLDRRRS
jgi:excisionase family DNA binding protein